MFSSNQPRKSFSKIGILANKHYASVLEHYRSENVMVFADKDVTFGGLKDIIRKEDKNISGSVLWLAFIGIYSIADQCQFDPCNLAFCKKPLTALEVEKDYHNYETTNCLIKSLINIILKLQKEVKEFCLREDSDFQIMPPVPISVLSNKYLNHGEIHSILRSEKHYIIVDRGHLTILNDVYITFCTEVLKALSDLANESCQQFYHFLEFYNTLDYSSILKNSSQECNVNELYKYHVKQLISKALIEEAPLTGNTHLNIQKSQNYDQIIFIGSEVIVNYISPHLPLKCSIFHAKFPIKWSEICDGLAVYKSKFKKILFTILADLTLITREIFDDDCNNYCQSKLSYPNLESESVKYLANTNIHCILDIKQKLQEYFQDNECVIVAPLFPRLGIRKPYVKSQSFHDLMHKVAIHSSSPLFLDGQMSLWDNSVSILKDLWHEQFGSMSPIKPFKETDHEIYMVSPLSWQLCSEYSLDQKSVLLTTWDKYIYQIATFYSQMSIPDRNEELNKFPRLTVPFDKSKDVDLYKSAKESITNYKIKESTPNTYIVGKNNFLNVLQDLKNYNSNINFLTKSFCNSTDLNISSILSEMVDVNVSNYVFFIFDINYITTENVLTQCTEQKCKDNHFAISLNYSSDHISMPKKIDNYLEEIEGFLNDFSKCTVALPLPIPPSQIYCNLKGIRSNHDQLQWIYNQAHFALGKKVKWINFLSQFEKDWNSLLLKHYNKFPKALSILENYQYDYKSVFNVAVFEDEMKGDTSAYEKWIDAIHNLVLSVTHKDAGDQNEQAISVAPVAESAATPHTVLGQNDYIYNSNEQSQKSINNTFYGNMNSELLSNQTISPITYPNVQYPQMQQNMVSDCSQYISNMQPNANPYANNTQENLTSFPAPITDMTPTTMQLQQGYEHISHPIQPLMSLQTTVKAKKIDQNNTPHANQKHSSTAPYAINLYKPGNGSQNVLRDNLKQNKNKGNTPVSVTISRISPTLPMSLLLDFAIDSSKEARILEETTDSLEIMFPYTAANLVVNQLNNERIGDCYIQVKFTNEPDKKPVEPNDQQNSMMSNILKKNYSKWSSAIVDAMEKQLSEGLDITTFKTKKCSDFTCEGNDSCMHYHWKTSKRRNPVQYEYSSIMCEKNARDCKEADRCKYSHNVYEQMYHPNNFQMVLCVLNLGKECSKYPFCKFAHTDTPELLFTKYWSDVIVFGLQNTLTYVAGALKGCNKLSQKKSVKIFVLSSNEQYLKLLKKVLRQTAKEYKMNTYLLDGWNENELFTNIGSIYMGTPVKFMASALMTGRNNDYMPSAIIIDDVEAIFKCDKQTENLHSFFQRLRRSPSYFATLQKVFVVDSYNEKSAGTISRFFGVQLKAIHKPISDSQSTAQKDALPTDVSQQKNDNLNKADIQSSSSHTDQSFNRHSSKEISSAISSTYKLPSAESSSKGQSYSFKASNSNSKLTSNKAQILTGKQPHFEKSFGRNKSISGAKKDDYFKGKSESATSFSIISPQKFTSSFDISNQYNTQKRKLTSNMQEEQFQSKKASRWASVEESKHTHTNQIPESQKSTDKLKAIIDVKYKLMQKQHEKMKPYMEAPEFHPTYERNYEFFLNNYRREFGRRHDEKHLNDKWKEYWRRHLDSVSNDIIKTKMKSLAPSEQVKPGNASTSRETTSASQKNPKSEEEFTVAKTLDILEELKDKFGILEHSLHEIINIARKYDPESDNALAVFANPEHIQLCKMIIEKMIKLKSESRYTGPIYDMAIQWTTELLEKASDAKGSKIDIQSIAEATIGKEPFYILNLIKSKLIGKSNIQPAKELVNKYFLDICSAHFHMTMGRI